MICDFTPSHPVKLYGRTAPGDEWTFICDFTSHAEAKKYAEKDCAEWGADMQADGHDPATDKSEYMICEKLAL